MPVESLEINAQPHESVENLIQELTDAVEKLNDANWKSSFEALIRQINFQIFKNARDDRKNQSLIPLIKDSLTLIQQKNSCEDPTFLEVDVQGQIKAVHAFKQKYGSFTGSPEIKKAIEGVIQTGYEMLGYKPKSYKWLVRPVLESIAFILAASLGMVTGGILGTALFPGLGTGSGILLGLAFGAAFGVEALGISHLWFGSSFGKIIGGIVSLAGSTGIGSGIGAILGSLAFPVVGTGIGAAIGAGFGAAGGIFLIGLSRLWAGKGKINEHFGFLATTLSASGIGAGVGALLGTFVFPGIGSVLGSLIGMASGLVLGVTLTGIAKITRGYTKHERFTGFLISGIATTSTGAIIGALLGGFAFGMGAIPGAIVGGAVGFAVSASVKIIADIVIYLTAKNEPIHLFPEDDSRFGVRDSTNSFAYLGEIFRDNNHDLNFGSDDDLQVGTENKSDDETNSNDEYDEYDEYDENHILTPTVSPRNEV
ncbi:hypothetical protein [Legionella londiniensis]|nr:hypothetical protein [Legionella londiniensis]